MDRRCFLLTAAAAVGIPTAGRVHGDPHGPPASGWGEGVVLVWRRPGGPPVPLPTALTDWFPADAPGNPTPGRACFRVRSGGQGDLVIPAGEVEVLPRAAG
jgi:hypothetical protein